MVVCPEHGEFRYISLFAGGGGLDLAVRLAFPNARCVLFVEREIVAAAQLVARIKDGTLDDAPIYSDVRSIDYGPWRGKIHGVIAGWPCPPVSVAGSRKGIEDERWLWPEVCRALRETAAGWFMGENVTGLLTGNDGRAFGSVLSDLDKGGFVAEWLCLSAAETGASHKRERVFLLARKRKWRRVRFAFDERSLEDIETLRSQGRLVADPYGQERRKRDREQRNSSAALGRAMADTRRECLSGRSSMHAGGVAGEKGAIEGDSGKRQWLRDTVGDGSAVVGDPALQPQREPNDETCTNTRQESRDDSCRPDRNVGDSSGDGSQGERCPRPAPGTAERASGNDVADAARVRQHGYIGTPGGSSGRDGKTDFPVDQYELGFGPPGPADLNAWRTILAVRPDLAPAIPVKPDRVLVEAELSRRLRGCVPGVNRHQRRRLARMVARRLAQGLFQEAAESEVRGVADGVAGGLDFVDLTRSEQLRLLGNGVHPVSAAVSLLILYQRLRDTDV